MKCWRELKGKTTLIYCGFDLLEANPCWKQMRVAASKWQLNPSRDVKFVPSEA